MSPLTKLFVVFQVILSLILSAGIVVYVNVNDNKQKTIEGLEIKAKASEQQRDQAEADKAAQTAIAQEAIQKNQQLVEQARSSSSVLQVEINKLGAQNAEMSGRMALQDSDLTRLTEALKSSEDTKSKLQDQLTAARQMADDRLTQNTQLNTTVSDLTNKLEVTERERKFLAEQLAEAKGTMEKQTRALGDAGISTAQLSSAGTRGGAPAINGVIRERRNINGVEYATISVGSNDSVVRGMQFKVVNREGGDFLGLLTVDTVEQTEATGRLTGPRVKDIRPGVEVKTQL